MVIHDQPDAEELRQRIADAITAHWKLLLLLGLILAILGLLAITRPLSSTLAVEILIGWLFCIGGALRVLVLARAKHMPGYWWSLLSSGLEIRSTFGFASAPARAVTVVAPHPAPSFRGKRNPAERHAIAIYARLSSQ